MMDDSSFIGVIMFSALISLTPGPNKQMLAASATNFGFFRNVSHIFGLVCGFTFTVLTNGFGLGGLINTFPAFHDIMRLFSILLLLFLSWRIAMAGKSSDQTSARPLSFLGPAISRQHHGRPYLCRSGIAAASAAIHHHAAIPDNPVSSVMEPVRHDDWPTAGERAFSAHLQYGHGLLLVACIVTIALT